MDPTNVLFPWFYVCVCVFYPGDYRAAEQADKHATAYASSLASWPTPVSSKEPAAARTPTLAELLSNLPPMPEGWKVGDPIPGMPALTAAQIASLAKTETVLVETGAKLADKTVSEPIEEVEEEAEPLKEEKAEEEIDVGVHEDEAQRPLKAAFNFALNPDMDIVFGATESESDSKDEESD